MSETRTSNTPPEEAPPQHYGGSISAVYIQFPDEVFRLKDEQIERKTRNRVTDLHEI